ncbi:MAG: hypothetical protein JEZ12_05865 [Desulfobacterium sp.]|nr:hypothetical protein [Desulfobacterium sp.]
MNKGLNKGLNPWDNRKEMRHGFQTIWLAIIGCHHCCDPVGSNLAWESIDKLYENHTVATIVTYAYPKEIENAMKRFPGNVIASLDETLCAKMLVGKRAEAAITDPNVMLYSAKKLGITNIKILKKDLPKKALVIALRNDGANKQRIEFLNKILMEN